MYEPIEKILGGLGKHWRTQADKRQVRITGEIGALREEVDSLSAKVNNLRVKDEIAWAYVIYDEEWHRRLDFEAVQHNSVPVPHISFPEFRVRWLREHAVTHQDEVWK